MFHALKPLTPKPEELDRCPALRIPAVVHCKLVWEQVYKAQLTQTNSKVVARLRACTAFREALPALDNYQNIRDFITCVVYAMAAEIMLAGTGPELLSAAKVALSAEARRPKSKLQEANSNSQINKSGLQADESNPQEGNS